MGEGLVCVICWYWYMVGAGRVSSRINQRTTRTYVRDACSTHSHVFGHMTSTRPACSPYVSTPLQTSAALASCLIQLRTVQCACSGRAKLTKQASPENIPREMGGGQSTEVPGGGTEAYHVLKVLTFYLSVANLWTVCNRLCTVGKFRYRSQTTPRLNVLDLNLISISSFLLMAFDW